MHRSRERPALQFPASWRAPVARQLGGDVQLDSLLRGIDAQLAREDAAGVTTYPPRESTFRALELTPFDRVRVVIIGQDPYHGESQAHGLAFSVPEGVRVPPSLRNILREVRDDTGRCDAGASLEQWARQGVVLLNTALTVRAHEPASHANIGWAPLTSAVIRAAAVERDHVAFLVWGAHAARCIGDIDIADRHLVLRAAHPSPLSARRGFFGCRHFSRTNVWLERNRQTPVRW